MPKNKLLTVLWLLLAVTLCASRTIEVKCNEFCTCDTYQNLRRATCQNKRLISIEINMAPEVQILDLSFNQVSEFGDQIFKDLQITNLKLLNISHNKISHIHFNAFEGLTELKTLDLSFNALRYITKSWFRSLNLLEELYLRGNVLRTFNDQPHIESKTLKVLDLSECGITHLKKDIFSRTPNLEILDLAGNFLAELKAEVIKPLKNLTLLNILHNNNMDCKSKSLVELKNYRKNKGFALKQPCKEKTALQKIHMFEKMIMQADFEPGLEKNSWIFEKTNQEELTKIIEVCSHNTSKEERFRKSFSTEGFDGFLMQIVNLSPIAVLLGLFLYGIFIGIIFGCFCRCDSKTRKRPHLDENSDLPDGATTFNTNLSRYSINNLNSYSYADHVSALGFPSGHHSREEDKPKSSKKLNGSISNESNGKRSNSFVRQLTRSKSIGSRPVEEIEQLMKSEFDLANSTPVTPRRVYVLPKNVFESEPASD